MTRGEATKIRVHYKGNEDDFIVFVDDGETYKKWKDDKSVPMAHFVSTFKVFTTHKQGTQGTYDAASHGLLDSEFGTHKEDEVVQKILESGTAQEVEMMDRNGPRNDSFSSMKAR